ncbi:hypothetical protein DCC25_05825 [Auritidibacter sp. NML120636]|nr:hypothetical protein DCC25_05825 [Auritidibacter sp. NML120636]
MSGGFGVDVPLLVRSADEIREVLDANPLKEIANDASKYLAVFLSKAPSPAQVAELEVEDFHPEVVKLSGRTAFVWTPNGVKDMRASSTALEQRFGVVATARSWNTLQKIAAAF